MKIFEIISLSKWSDISAFHHCRLLPFSQGQHDKTLPWPTHRAITRLASLFCSDAHDEHRPDKFSRSIGHCTISIQQINVAVLRWHVVHGYTKVHSADLPPDQRPHFVFTFIFVALPSSRWCIHAANITLRAEREITVVLHEKLFHNKMKFLYKEYWAVGCLWHR